MFTEAFEAILVGHCSPAVVRAVEVGGDRAPLWTAIADAGFLDLMAAEDAGGAGLDLAAVLPILSALGYHAVPLPVGEAIVLRALLPAGTIPAAQLPTLAPALRRLADGSAVVPRLPYGAFADQVLAQEGRTLLLLDAGAATRTPGAASAASAASADPTADLAWSARALASAATCRPVGTTEPDVLPAWAAALHAALLCGALTRSFELTLQYGNERSQFGRSIGKFQAIQHQLAVMAEHVAAARMATAAAFGAGRSTPALLPAALAKARASEAVTVVAPIAHAIHGAIGVTEEFDLQLFTRRLHGWRLAHGSESYWQRRIGQAVLAAEHSGLASFVREVTAGIRS